MSRWVASGALVVVGAALGVGLLQSPVLAVCVPHALTVEPATAAAGSVVTVRGEAWFVGCNDTGQATPEPPDTAALTVEQGGKVFDLGRAPADEDYRFTVEVRLPAELEHGDATIVGRGKGGQAQATITVTGGDELALTGGGAASGAAALAALGLAVALVRSRALQRS